MKPRKPRFSLANPFLTWTSLALKTSEMMLASAQVISHRTSRMMLAGVNPSVRDRREFTLMGQEKIEAATESIQAVATRMMVLPMQLSALLFRQMMSGASSMSALTLGPAAVLSTKGQMALMQDTLTRSTTMATQVSGSLARLVQHGIKPIHSRATSNAERLLKGG